MPFGAGQITVELQLAGVWTDITTKTRVVDGISINRGRSNEGSVSEPADCKLVLNNADGRFSPRNPSGPYYGLIGRNTPIRVSVNLGLRRLVPGDENTRGYTTPDSVGLSITGDIDIRYDGMLPTWDVNQVLVGKYGAAGQRSYRMYIDSVGLVSLGWSADGTAELFAKSAVPVPRLSGRQAIRATLDVDNGAGGRTITFFTAPTIAGPWTQLGDPVVQAGVTSIFDSTTTLAVLAVANGGAYGAQVRQGIGGTVRANVDFTTQAEGTAPFVDSAGNTWTAGSFARVTNRRVRFIGEVAAWPVGWSHAEHDVAVSLTAAGIRRRLSQGQASLKSPMTRAMAGAASVIAYWPMEDGSDAVQFGSGLATGRAMTFTSVMPGDVGVSPAADGESFEASDPLPTWSGGYGIGTFPASSTGTYQVRWFGYVPNAGAVYVGGALLMSMRFAGGNVERIDLAVNQSGSLNIAMYGPLTSGGSGFIDGSGYVNFAVLGKTLRYEMYVVQAGANVTMRIGTMPEGATSGSLFVQNVSGRTLGSLSYVVVAPMGSGGLGPLTGVTIGQVSVQEATSDFFDLAAVLDGYSGESSANRAGRLATEEAVPTLIRGIDLMSAPMGVQGRSTFLDLIDQTAYTDGGLSSEEITSAKLMVRTLRSLYNQPALQISYSRLIAFEPTEDDQATVNDLTINRVGGATARHELTTGPLSTQAPPNGIGRYDAAEDLSLAADAQVQHQAAWRVALGTVDEPRYPVIVFDALNAGLTAAEQTALMDMIEADALTITNPPTFAGAPDNVTQLVAGWAENITPSTYQFEVVGIPATPFRVWQIGSAEYGRLDSSTTVTNGALTTTATAVPHTGDAWITSAARPQDFPFEIEVGGEVMRVTANSASVGGTFTVVRSVNGIVKTHAAGASITLARPVHFALH